MNGSQLSVESEESKARGIKAFFSEGKERKAGAKFSVKWTDGGTPTGKEPHEYSGERESASHTKSP